MSVFGKHSEVSVQSLLACGVVVIGETGLEGLPRILWLCSPVLPGHILPMNTLALQPPITPP